MKKPTDCPACAEWSTISLDKDWYCFAYAVFYGKSGMPKVCDPDKCEHRKEKEKHVFQGSAKQDAAM